MKNIFISICCVVMFSVFSVQAAMPNEGSNKKTIKKTKKVNAKCHVALIDGSEAIIFYRIQANKLAKLADSVQGKKISTQKSLGKIKVYRAFECVLEEDDFTSGKALALDQKTPR